MWRPITASSSQAVQGGQSWAGESGCSPVSTQRDRHPSQLISARPELGWRAGLLPPVQTQRDSHPSQARAVLRLEAQHDQQQHHPPPPTPPPLGSNRGDPAGLLPQPKPLTSGTLPSPLQEPCPPAGPEYPLLSPPPLATQLLRTTRQFVPLVLRFNFRAPGTPLQLSCLWYSATAFAPLVLHHCSRAPGTLAWT